APDHTAVAQGSLPTTDDFALTLTDTGRLIAQVRSDGPATRLSLLGPNGEVLVQSDGQSATNLDDLIVQHLQPGTSFLQVETLDGSAGHYQLTANLLSALPPFQPLPLNATPSAVVTGDFNGDGIPDLAAAESDSNSVAI